LQSTKKALDEKDFLLRKYKSTTDNFRKMFICIFNKLSQFSLILSSFKESNEENQSNHAEIISQISKDSKGIMEVLPKFSEGFDSSKGQHEELIKSLNDFMESIENKIKNLISNLLNTKVKKNEISKLIDGVLNEEKIEFFSKEIIEENKSLRILLENNTNLLENVIKNPDVNLLEEMKILSKKQNEEIAAVNKQLEEMKNSTRRIKQKLASSPYLPFIIVKDIETVNIKSHNCLCFYCGIDIVKENEVSGNANAVACSNNNNNSNNTQIINGINYTSLSQENKILKDNEDIDRNNRKNLPSPSQDVEMNDITNLKNGNISLTDFNANKNNEISTNTNIAKEKGDEKSINIRNLFLDPIQETEYFTKSKFTNNKNNKDLEKDLSLNEDPEKEKDNNQISKSPYIPSAENQNNLNNINSSFSNNSPENEQNILDEENKQNLEILYRKLYNSYLNLKFEKNISYQGLIKSKPFQVLLTQIENCINTIDSQKSEILHMKKHMSEVHNQISSQEKFYKFDKMKDVNLLEEKIEKMQKDFSLKENEKQKMQIEINKLEEFIKTVKNFDYAQLTSIDEFYKNKNVDLIEMLKSQAKINLEKYQAEYEKCESFEKSNLKLQMELDRFKTALSKYENVEGVESKKKFNFLKNYFRFTIREIRYAGKRRNEATNKNI
jgi:hypothetical protein